MGGTLPFTFTVGLVLFAWFATKWNSLKRLDRISARWEIALGFVIVIGNFVRNFLTGSVFGLVDMLITFAGLAIAFYGLKSLRFFWVPSAYLGILILGYQAESALPEVKTLEDWLAYLMANTMQTLGIRTTVSQNIVTLYGPTPLFLQIDGPCTGIKGILAFGMLASMAVLDVKSRVSRVVPILAIGFLGAFAINILRLFGIFLAFAYLGPDLGIATHVYLGYALFIAWVLVFWSFALRYLAPRGRLPAAAVVVT